ncbi:MAG: hypothetical protein IPO09_20485 [Anaeromyxobacter sp.]|nr:hypothetical protein [Anaeromyxobacter sp.]MBL0274831.1 hypothetical protein [Anaeromyxobacter sp.]
MGRLSVGMGLLAVALGVGFAPGPDYGFILTVAIVASAGAAYFLWTSRQAGRWMLNASALGGVVLASLNTVQALLRLLS